MEVLIADEARSILLDLVIGVVRLVVDGNKAEIEKEINADLVPAVMQIGGENIEGQHSGSRTKSKGVRSYKTFMLKRYRPIACAQGEFISATVRYTGGFWEGQFHDLSGKAKLDFGKNCHYEGSFCYGKRSDYGELRLYDRERNDFYLYFKGLWKNDQPWSGEYFSPQGQVTIKVENAVLVPSSSPSSSSLPLPPQQPPAPQSPNPPPSPSPIPAPEIPAPLPAPSQIAAEADEPLVLQRLLADPTVSARLSTSDSIEVLAWCIRQGQRQSRSIAGKDALILLGNTGAGKSTFANYLAGCKMIIHSKAELQMSGSGDVISVCPSSVEIAPIGHLDQSKTFLPNIAMTPDGRTFCDCPGFFDNRGAEINIANAVNIRTAMTKANSVKIVILLNYHALKAVRGRAVSDMVEICNHLFSNEATLLENAASLLICVSNIPIGDKSVSLQSLKEDFQQRKPEAIMRALSERLFIFDPLDRPLTGGWNQLTCVGHIAQLTPIKDPQSIFQTVLTDGDEKKLIEIGESMKVDIKEALTQNQYAVAANRYFELESLTMIHNIVVERIVSQAALEIGRHLQEQVAEFRLQYHSNSFETAGLLLDRMRCVLKAFERTDSDLDYAEQLEEDIDMKNLESEFSSAKQQFEQDQAKQKQLESDAISKQDRIEELVSLLEEQKLRSEEQIRQLENRFELLQKSTKSDKQNIERSYTAQLDNLRVEMELQIETYRTRIADDQAISAAQQRDIEQTREKLQAEYESKKVEIEHERDELVEHHNKRYQEQTEIHHQMQEKYQRELNALKDQLSIVSSDSGAIRHLITQLQNENPAVKERAAGALVRLVTRTGNEEWIAEQGGIQALIALLTTHSSEVQEYAANALIKLSEKAENQQLIPEKGGIEALIAILNSSTTTDTTKDCVAGAF